MVAPTDLNVVLKFVCRGGYYPPAIYKNIIAFCTGSRGRLPLQVCARLIFLIVGATTMFSKKTCGLPSGRPSFIKISFCLKRTVGDAGPYKICGIFDILSVGEDIILPFL